MFHEFMSSLQRVHANLLCLIPILVLDMYWQSEHSIAILKSKSQSQKKRMDVASLILKCCRHLMVYLLQ